MLTTLYSSHLNGREEGEIGLMIESPSGAPKILAKDMLRKSHLPGMTDQLWGESFN